MSCSLFTTRDESGRVPDSAGDLLNSPAQRYITISFLILALILLSLVTAYFSEAAWIRRLGESEIDRESNELVQVGTDLLQRGRYALAISNLKEALELDPDSGPAHLALGEAYIATGAYEQATTTLQRALGQEPPLDDLVYLRLGEICERQGKLDRALEFYRIAGDTAPYPTTALINIGRIFLVRGNHQEAVTHLEQALRQWHSLKTHYRATLLLAGRLYYDEPEVAAVINESLRREIPDELLSRYDSQTFEDWIEFSPRSIAIHDLLGQALAMSGRFTEGMAHLRKALHRREDQGDNNASNSDRYLTVMGQAYQADGQFAEAIFFFRKLLAFRKKQLGEDHPNTIFCLLQLGRLNLSEDDPARARQFFSQALTRREATLGRYHTSLLPVMNNLIRCHQLLGDQKAIAPLFQRILEITGKQSGPDHPQTAAVMNSLAVLHRSLGNLDEAEKFHQQALKIRLAKLGDYHADVGRSLRNLAVVYRTRGNLLEAERLHRKALNIFKKSMGPQQTETAQSLWHLADTLEARGLQKQAAKLYRQALTIYTKNLGPRHPKTLNLTKVLEHCQEVSE